jgi:hypothetical protein
LDFWREWRFLEAALLSFRVFKTYNKSKRFLVLRWKEMCSGRVGFSGVGFLRTKWDLYNHRGSVSTDPNSISSENPTEQSHDRINSNGGPLHRRDWQPVRNSLPAPFCSLTERCRHTYSTLNPISSMRPTSSADRASIAQSASGHE